MKAHNQMKQFLLAGLLGTVMTVGGVAMTQVPAQAADEPTTGQTTTEPHADQDQVEFGDPTLEKIVANGLGVAGPVTYGEIRNYSGKQLALNYFKLSEYDQNATTPILLTSVEGLQSLQELPNGIGVSIQVSLKSGVSLAPFKGLPVSGSFNFQQDNMHNGDFTDLNDINFMTDPTQSSMRSLRISGVTKYQNFGGLTDTDIQKLKPLFAKFSSLRPNTLTDGIRVTVAHQRLSDFTFFKQFAPIDLLAIGEVEVAPQKTYIDPDTFTQDTEVRLPAQVKGLDGEPVQTSTYVYSNDSHKLTMDGTDALVKGITPNIKYIMIDQEYLTENYPDVAPIEYADGSELTTDGVQYYPVAWQKAPDESSDSSSTTQTPGTDTTLPDETSSSTTSASETSDEADQAVAPKGSVVYAVKPIYLYQRPTFKHAERQAKYVKQPRINRPMFVVTGYAQSVNGRARYLVKDVNHHSKTTGKTGYITANSRYTVPVYYQKKATKVTVINPAGVTAYRQVGLKKRVTHYRQGTTLKVTGLKHYRLTTRFKLSNGTYVTANRKLVTTQKTSTPAYIRTKTTINRYRTVNLTGKRGSYAAKKRVKVLGWAYSQPNNFAKFGTLRYHVAGGYVTANAKYVQAIR
ncbi:DUF5776 domain-containing protein [Levilactobacillus sp. HBUAS70063]|uniref:DUF5776 domain-containing protein n=1 Tax=Levilactobacillus sp. HBUAS70063 TaxID=3109359 RepID=UPI0031331BAB